MKARQTVRRRGQPLLALILLMVSWVGARAAMWEAPVIQGVHQGGGQVARPAVKPAPARAATKQADRPDIGRIAPKPSAPPPVGIAPLTAPVTEPSVAPPNTEPASPVPEVASPQVSQKPPPSVIVGHQLLYSVGMNMPTIEDSEAADTPRRALPSQVVLIQPAGSRWSGDAWLLLREGGNGFNAPGAGLPGVVVPVGFYGGSQAGAVLRYRLAMNSPLRPALYLRGSSGLEYPRGEELAVGLSLRPLPGLPVSLMAEGRVTRTTTGTIVRPALAVVSEFPPARLPLGIRGEAYVQAGYVGGQGATPFIDGQARLERPVARVGKAEFRLGGGTWGGAQRGASRLDLGPTATLAVPIGPAGARVSADYRIRVAGQAAPGSGAVLTLSAGF